MWNFSNEKPVYLQIMEELKMQIISGSYKPGERIPSVRDLAEEARVNPNTMQKALSEIEREGFLISLRTSGKYVTDDAEFIKNVREDRAGGIVKEFADNMGKLGISADEAVEMLKMYYCKKNNKG